MNSEQTPAVDSAATDRRNWAFAVGLLCGAAAGLAIGLLYAPKPGAATRQDLARSANGLRRSATAAYQRAAGRVANVAAAARGTKPDQRVPYEADHELPARSIG